jgi:lipoic acid synthetase
MKPSTQQFPPWIRRTWPSGASFQEVKDLLGDLKLHTVCQSAHCPNQAECWGRKTATFMVLGNVCTRHCTYCAVHSGKPQEVMPEEPEQIAEAVVRLGLKHTVLTSVTRDDLPDGGADHIARSIQCIHERSRETTVEVLVQDFNADVDAIRRVLQAKPEVFSHNIETVERIHPKLRDRRFGYRQSLEVLSIAARHADGAWIKTGLMVGCGETREEVLQTLQDLHNAGCQAVSIGQYLQPTGRHHNVDRFVTPEEFASYETAAYEIGLAFAVAGPFVRSSYRSEELMAVPRNGNLATAGVAHGAAD